MAGHIIYEAQIAAVKEIQPVKRAELKEERCENLVWPTKADVIGLELPVKKIHEKIYKLTTIKSPTTGASEPAQGSDELATSVLVNSRSSTQETTASPELSPKYSINFWRPILHKELGQKYEKMFFAKFFAIFRILDLAENLNQLKQLTVLLNALCCVH